MFPVYPLWLSVEHFCCSILWQLFQTNVVQPITPFLNDVVIPIAEPVVLNAVFEFNRAKIRSTIAVRSARKQYFMFNYLCLAAEQLATIVYYGWLLFTRNYVENEEPIWISVYTQSERLTVDPNNRYGDEVKTYSLKYGWQKMAELYKQSHCTEKNDMVGIPALMEEFICKYTCLFSQIQALLYQDSGESEPETEQTVQNWMNDYLRLDTRQNTMIIGKFGENIRIIRNVDASILISLLGEDAQMPISSEVDFLAVEYTAYPGANPISIEIPRSHYMVGNELLSKQYIYRYLRYLPTYVGWDYTENYTIKCIDDGLHECYLKSGQCILLREDTYEIITEDTDICVANSSTNEQTQDEWEKIDESPK